MPVQLTLYIREGCSLCDDMERALHECAADLDFETRRYPIGERTVPEPEICHYFLDLQALKRAVA